MDDVRYCLFDLHVARSDGPIHHNGHKGHKESNELSPWCPSCPLWWLRQHYEHVEIALAADVEASPGSAQPSSISTGVVGYYRVAHLVRAADAPRNGAAPPHL